MYERLGMLRLVFTITGYVKDLGRTILTVNPLSSSSVCFWHNCRKFYHVVLPRFSGALVVIDILLYCLKVHKSALHDISLNFPNYPYKVHSHSQNLKENRGSKR